MTGRASIEIVAAPVVNHAMAHNGLSFCHRIVVAVPVELIDVAIEARLVDDFGTTLTQPWRHIEPVINADSPLVLANPTLRLDGQRLSAVEEETSAALIVTAESAGRVLVEQRQTIRVLAARQWTFDSAAPQLSLELLSAFVQPNHPAVLPVVTEAADQLVRATGRGSLEVAEATPERIDAIVEAVFTAVHDRGISYAEPPPSWGYGQRVRTAEDVFRGRVGTCLDTTIAIASVLEHLRIAPVVWIATGHAFLGYWRWPDRGLPDAASLQVATAANAVDLRLMGVLETTLVTRERRPPRDLFRRAAQAPLDSFFQGGTSSLLGVVDIGMARLLQVYPVPARRERLDGVVEVIDYVPATAPSPVKPVMEAGASTSPAAVAEPAVPPRVQLWKNALLDLTLRNRLLNLNQPLTQVRLLVPNEQLGTLADLLQDGKSVSIRAVDDLTGAVISEGARDAYALPADVQRAMLSSRSTIYSGQAKDAHERELSRLRYRARTGREETGANPLMLVLGRLDWRLGDRELSAPLLLMPVEIRGLVMPYRIAADPSGSVGINLSLLQKLQLEFGFTAPELTELPLRSDGEGVDVDAVIRLFREALAAAGLAFRVESEARLIIGGFTGFLLWRDLDQHWADFADRPLVRQLLAEREPTPELPSIETEELDEVVARAPIAADGSQAGAIAYVRQGVSFVLEGPPGTGKSQTITNILADQLTAGRTVLFVAEKGAALDVVRQRLGEVGLLPYTLDLHDQNARPSEVRARLKSALDQRSQADLEGFRVAGNDVASAAATLRNYRRRLHEPNELGLSLWSARDSRLARGDGPTLTIPAAALGGAGPVRSTLDSARDALSGLDPTTADLWAWAGSAPVGSEVLSAALDRADDAATAALAGLDAAGSGLEPLLREARDLTELAALTRLTSEQTPGGAALAELGTPRWTAARAELGQRTDALAAEAEPAWADFDPAVLGVDLDSVRQALREAEQSFFLGRKGRLVRAAAPVLARLRPGRSVAPKALTTQVDELARLAVAQEQLAGSWRQLPGVDLPPEVALAAPEGRRQLSDALADLDTDQQALGRLAPATARSVIAARRTGPAVPGPLTEQLERAVDGLTAVIELTGGQPADLIRFSTDGGLLARWSATASARTADGPRFLGLLRWQRAAEALAPLAETLPEARWQLLTIEVRVEDASAALDRGAAAASLAERWESGGFAGFDAEAHDRAAARFVAASAELREQLRTAGPAAVIDQRPFRTGGLFGQVAALDREVSRSRGGLSVRKLISNFGPVIAEVTPCVLVSPDSLARFVPPGAIDFDLVVFDEASQITVADAIGALGRARSAVVAGDSKQLPPTQFAALSSEQPELADEDEFLVVPDEESILSEFGQSGFPRVWLSWHYRSQDESLISFSNTRYYADRLSSFPAVPVQQHDSGVSFTRVPGVFLRGGRRTGEDRSGQLRTNPVEAAAVVTEVLRRWEQRERSIGVVTFNIQQRGLIERMLWDSEVPGIREALALKSDGLFVKNLENVQGDERDVIIFSTGFSVSEDGVLPLNFGPLNRFGGERRLNVAVTRARRRVMVFSSFEPEDIRLADTSSVGLRHLREYLELAKYGVPERPHDHRAGRHAAEIADALRAAGCTVRTEVGLSDFRVDLAVAPPGADHPVLAVLLDSPVWAGRATTSDRDGLPYTVLRDVMGWPAVRRVWLPEWLTDRERVVTELVQAAYAAAEQPRQVGEAVVSGGWAVYEPEAESAVDDAVVEESELEPSDAELDPEPAEPAAEAVDESYVEPELAARSLNALDRAEFSQRAQVELGELITEIVTQSGPISVERLGRRVVRIHGLSRMSDSRLAVIRRLIPESILRDPEEGFLWPEVRDPLRWTGYRRSSDLKDRPLTDIALREIVNAMTAITEAAMGITDDELIKQTFKVFGGNRMTQPAGERLRAALALAEKLGRLVIRAGVVTLSR